MTELTASVSNPVAGANRLSIEIADAVQLYAGGLAALRGPAHATSQGYADALNDEVGHIPLGGWWSDETLGDTQGDPVVNPENNVDIKGKVWRRKAVTGVASRGDIGKLVYASDDNVLTLTRPAANALPLGVVVEWHTSTTADVLLFGFETLAAISLGGGGSELMCLGSFDVTISASANLATGLVMPCHGVFTDFYAVIDGADLAGAGGDVDINLEIGGTNTTGGVISLLIASPTAGTKVSGTAFTGAQRFHEGDLVDIEAVVNTAFTTGRVVLYANVQRELGY